MPIAILDPFSGISGDMTLGALIDLGVQWLYTHLGGRLSGFLGNHKIRKWFERGVGAVFIILALVVVFTFRQGGH